MLIKVLVKHNLNCYKYSSGKDTKVPYLLKDKDEKGKEVSTLLTKNSGKVVLKQRIRIEYVNNKLVRAPIGGVCQVHQKTAC